MRHPRGVVGVHTAEAAWDPAAMGLGGPPERGPTPPGGTTAYRHGLTAHTILRHRGEAAPTAAAAALERMGLVQDTAPVRQINCFGRQRQPRINIDRK